MAFYFNFEIMKKLILLSLLFLILASCKKASNTTGYFQVKVSGLTSITNVTFNVKDNTQNLIVLSETNVSNGTYTSTQQVHSGDQMTITCHANVNDDLAGDGDGSLQFYFNGQLDGAHGGQINISGFSIDETIPNP